MDSIPKFLLCLAVLIAMLGGTCATAVGPAGAGKSAKTSKPQGDYGKAKPPRSEKKDERALPKYHKITINNQTITVENGFLVNGKNESKNTTNVVPGKRSKGVYPQRCTLPGKKCVWDEVLIVEYQPCCEDYKKCQGDGNTKYCRAKSCQDIMGGQCGSWAIWCCGNDATSNCFRDVCRKHCGDVPDLCDRDSNCCGDLRCVNGRCDDANCRDSGKTCFVDADCCNNGVCIKPNTLLGSTCEKCRSQDQPCSKHGECCSKDCSEATGTCQCLGFSTRCNAHYECCDGAKCFNRACGKGNN